MRYETGLDLTTRFLVAHFLPHIVSGAERAIADFIDRLDGRFEAVMLTPGEGDLADYYRRRGFEVWANKIHTPRRRYPGLHTLQSIFFARILRQRKIHAVVCNTFAAASRIGTASRLAGIPYAIYVREYISDKPLHRRILAQADRIFVISQDLRAYIGAMADLEKIRVASDPILAPPILDRVKAHRDSGNRLVPFEACFPVVGLVGRITPFKQQDLFVQAIPLVLAAVPEARFAVVGSSQVEEQDYEAYVKRLAVQLDIQDRVAFMGHRWDAIEITSEFTLACLTSTREPLGRVTLEAQLMGCPVIVPDTGGAAETVEDGVTGLHFPSTGLDAVQQLAGRIVRLLKNPELRSLLAENARLAVTSTFASERPVRQLEQWIGELAGKHPGASRGA